jgi:hypothetical protein
MTASWRPLAIACALVGLLPACGGAAGAAPPAPLGTVRLAEQAGGRFKRPAIMAPLVVEDWPAFDSQLQRAKAIGVVAASTDVWWGAVEGAGDQQFDWTYYDRVSAAILAAGLKWVPIFSFHKCGGNVGDTCNIPLPGWVWTQLGGQNPDALKYRSERGNLSDEVISLWADAAGAQQYREFVSEFATHFASIAGELEELNVSAGPSGELRYPSYNAHDHFSYPQRGFLQAYADAAVDDLRASIKTKYTTLAAVNQAWGIQLQTWDDVRPPSDADGFFARRDYLDITYGKDFTAWYNGALVEHGRRMLSLVSETLAGRFPGVPIGIKVPGIHWQMSSPSIPRSAEISAGLINSALELDDEATAHGYAPILDMLGGVDLGRPVVLHFTCLEMDNTPGPDAYSRAKDLVFWVGGGAGARHVPIMGENALSGGVTNDAGWNNIDNAIRWSTYSGLTVLRVSDLESNGGLGFTRYASLIDTFM